MNARVVILFVIAVCPLCQGAVLTVDAGGGGQYTSIQAAINAAKAGDTVQVAGGTYHERIRFNGKAITVGGSGAVIDGTGLFGSLVTFDSGEGADAMLVGFDITNGRSTYGGGVYCGNRSSPTISACRILNNTATSAGGGICCTNNGHPTVADCNISGNTASGDGGGLSCYSSCSPNIMRCVMKGNRTLAGGGGAIACDTWSCPVVTDCLMSMNTSGRGAIRCSWESNPVITHCRITGNQGGDGGAVSILNSCPQLANCLIIGNTATQNAGAVDSYYMSHPVLTNCSIVANTTAGQAGGIRSDDGGITVVNCIVWGNSAGSGSTLDAQIYTNAGSPDVSFSCVQDESPAAPPVPFGDGHHNVDTDPLFQRLPNDGGDGWGGVNDDYGDLQLCYSSPCIDAGDNAAATDISDMDLDGSTVDACPVDIDHNDRFRDDPSAADVGTGTPPIVDMGAYESPGHEIPRVYPYTFTDLGTLGGNESKAYCVNNAGLVVGVARLTDGNDRATLFDPSGRGGNIDLGTLGGVSSEARAVNDQGQIVGTAGRPDGLRRATWFDPTGGAENRDLGTTGGDHSVAMGINNDGWVVGGSDNGQLRYRAALFHIAGGFANVDLGSAGGRHSEALTVSDKGVIVGSAQVPSTQWVAVRFDASGGGDNTLFGSLGEAPGRAQSINRAGQIVGWGWTAMPSSQVNAAVFDPTCSGNNIGLGALGGVFSSAYWVNNRGWIVGYAADAQQKKCAVLFDPSGRGNNLNLNDAIDPNLGWHLAEALCINDAGWIVGVGITPDIRYGAYLLKPTDPPVSVVGDADDDGHVTLTDCAAILGNWGADTSDPWPECEQRGDLNGDCRVDFTDVKLMTAQWLR